MVSLENKTSGRHTVSSRNRRLKRSRTTKGSDRVCTGGAVVQSFGVAEHDDRGYNTLHEAFDWLTQRIADSS